MGVRVRNTQTTSATAGLAAGAGAQERTPESERPAGQGQPLEVKGGNGASGPEPDRTQNGAGREGGDGAGKRSRQLIARIVRLHGGRIQRGKSDGA